MKRIAMLILGVGVYVTTHAQMNVTLNLNHEFDGSAFALGQNFTDWDGNTVTISRAQYYLSGFEIVHDGGQSSTLPATYVLAAGNVTTYDLGAHNIAVTAAEGINFDLGVDQVANHDDPAQYSLPHPLALQNPSTHWGWNSGYRFLMLEGEVDTNNDNVPDTPFEIHVVGDQFLTDVTISNVGVVNGSDIVVDVNVNISDWLRNINLSSVGAAHGSGATETAVINNTLPQTVFTGSTPNSIDDSNLEEGMIAMDYSLPYAPTINYQFLHAKTVDLVVIDINGRTIIQAAKLAKEGRFFLNKELPTGTYFAIITGDNGVVKSTKFMVQK